MFFVTGGSCWMLCYSLCPKIVADEAEATEATRLLNLTTQVGVLVGILVGMLPHTAFGEKLYESHFAIPAASAQPSGFLAAC